MNELPDLKPKRVQRHGGVNEGGVVRKSKELGITGVEEARRVGSWQERRPGPRLVPDGKGLEAVPRSLDLILKATGSQWRGGEDMLPGGRLGLEVEILVWGRVSMQEAGSGCHTPLGCRGCPRRQCALEGGGGGAFLYLDTLSFKQEENKPTSLVAVGLERGVKRIHFCLSGR